MKNSEKRSNERVKNIEELGDLAEKTVNLLHQLGVEHNLDEGIREVQLILNVAKALREYVCFKEEQRKR